MIIYYKREKNGYRTDFFFLVKLKAFICDLILLKLVNDNHLIYPYCGVCIITKLLNCFS